MDYLTIKQVPASTGVGVFGMLFLHFILANLVEILKKYSFQVLENKLNDSHTSCLSVSLAIISDEYICSEFHSLELKRLIVLGLTLQ